MANHQAHIRKLIIVTTEKRVLMRAEISMTQGKVMKNNTI